MPVPVSMGDKRTSKKRSLPQERETPQEASDEEFRYSDDEGDIIEGIRIPPATKPTLSFDPTGPRLIITKIVNNFFKSYAEEQVLGPFHKCFNAIVGPNGSGKSNVIDSMLFVFGYRATKIRSKKVSVLLHNSEKFRNVQKCTVSVHFAQIIDRDGDNYDIVPRSEFVVSRSALKDNSSYYTLDGKKVQFKEVGKLLKSHGIDLDHNRFLILQGEVEQIAMMNCKGDNENETGMLEYLEDIIGTTRYKKPLMQVNEKIEYFTEFRTEKLNRLKLVEREMEELKGPMEVAVGFLKTENKVVRNKNFLYQKNIYSYNKKIEKLSEEKAGVVEVLTGFQEKLKALSEQKSEKEKVIKQQSATYEHLEKRKESLTEAFNKANNKDIQLQETMRQTNMTRKKTKELILEEQKRLENLKGVPEKSKAGIEECEVKIQEETVKKEKYEEEKTKLLSTIRTETKSLQEEKEAIQNKLVGLKKNVDETKSEFVLAESELKIFVSNEENERKKLENLTEEYESCKSTIEERTKQIASLKKKIPATEKSLNDALRELNGIKQEEAQLINEVRKSRSSLEEKRNSMQATRSQGKVLDGLTAQKREGNCPGLYGRLGDLGAIDQKYDVAISTACGALDNIVVDSVETAKWCIEFLKKYDLGRATFIALDKQEHLRQRANSKINTPENVHRLYDLVKVADEDVKTAFYYALRDTLVANDLDQASRIAYGAQRFRVVTLKGELIETTGAMSGGGRTVSRGRMGQAVKRVSTVNPRELENMEEDIGTMENSIRELRQKQTNLENQISALQPELRQMKFNMEKFTMELKDLYEQRPVLEQQLQEQKQKSGSTKANPEQVKKLTKVVEQKKRVYDEAAEKANVLQRQVDKLTQEIKDKTTGKMRAVDKHLKDATSTIDKCKAEITRLRVAVTTAQRNSKKSEDKIKSMEEDVVNMENRLRQMRDERDEIEEDGKKLLKCIEEITEQLAEGQESYADIKKEVAQLVKEENKLKSDKVDIDQKFKTVDGKIKDCKANIHQLEVKITRLKLQDVINETVEELKKYTDEELETEDEEAIQKDLEAAENHLKVAKPNLNAIIEYRQKQTTYIERSKELEEINQKRIKMRQVYDDLKIKRKDEFMTGFNIIKLKLKEMYQMITLGGDADFEMVDNYDPFTEGIQFNVRPPKKSWKKIANLSGGEKTLSSLALVFALHYYKPSPLYVMDEIDAALDFKNVSIVGNYIKDRTKNAQFIIISLRSNMFELSDNLIGIYKTYNCTKTITLDPRIYDEALKMMTGSNQQVVQADVHNNASGEHEENDEEEEAQNSGEAIRNTAPHNDSDSMFERTSSSQGVISGTGSDSQKDAESRANTSGALEEPMEAVANVAGRSSAPNTGETLQNPAEAVQSTGEAVQNIADHNESLGLESSEEPMEVDS